MVLICSDTHEDVDGHGVRCGRSSPNVFEGLDWRGPIPRTYAAVRKEKTAKAYCRHMAYSTAIMSGVQTELGSSLVGGRRQ